MNKKVLLGCGLAVFLVLVAFAVVLAMFGTKVVNFASEIINEGQERSSWIAPADGASGEALFPATLGEANRRSIENITDLAALNIRQDGEHASYRMSNGAAVEVYAWNVAQSEVDAFFAGAGKAIDDGPYNLRTKVTLGQSSMRFSFSPPSTSGRFWFNKGWMFLFLTEDGIELEPLEEACIKAVAGAGTGSTGLLPEVEAAQ